MFHGSIPALITPFRNTRLDEAGFQTLVERQIANGSHALAPCGTTGESVTLSLEEHVRVVSLCVEVAARRAPVIAGAGSNNTAHAVALAQRLEMAGADAVLLVAPYYNKPNPAGVLAHFRAVHDAIAIPIIVYNVPGRTVIDIGVDTMARLAELERVVGVKDASGDVGRVARHRLACGADFVQLSGEDASAIGFNAEGGSGCISVTANVAPRQCAALQEATRAGDFVAARALADALAPLHAALFVEPSPAPAKYACALLGLCTDEVRLPLVPLSETAKAAVRDAMTSAGIL